MVLSQVPLVRLLRHTSDNNCALCDKSVKLATFEGIQMLNNSGYGGIAESTCIRNTRVLNSIFVRTNYSDMLVIFVYEYVKHNFYVTDYLLGVILSWLKIINCTQL